ncbi:MAG: glycosyltransferase family 4 protein [Elusimicrobiota bacterium]
MKVLHVITRMDPGGSSSICRKVVNGMKKEGIEVYLASGKSEAEPRNCEEDIIGLRFLQREIRLFNDIAAVFELCLLIKKIKPDALHLHTSKAGLIGRIAGRLTGIRKIFYQPHGIVFYGYFSKLKSNMIVLAERLMAGSADRIIVLTKRAKQEFLEYRVGKEEQYIIIEDGITFSRFRGASDDERIKIRRELGIEPGWVVAGIIGRIVKLKGHRYFVDAISSLAEAYPGLRGLIAGEGEDEEDLKKYIEKKNSSGRFIFCGYRNDIEKIMPALDMLVQPSLVEGFGLTVIEAGASSVPVVGFDVGGISDIIQDKKTGLLAEYKDIDSLKSKIRYLADNPDKRLEMGKNAREYVRENYTDEKMMKKVMDLYREEKARIE